MKAFINLNLKNSKYMIQISHLSIQQKNFLNFIVVQVHFSAFSPHPSLIPSPPHLPPIPTPFPLLSMCHSTGIYSMLTVS